MIWSHKISIFGSWGEGRRPIQSTLHCLFGKPSSFLLLAELASLSDGLSDSGKKQLLQQVEVKPIFLVNVEFVHIVYRNLSGGYKTIMLKRSFKNKFCHIKFPRSPSTNWPFLTLLPLPLFPLYRLSSTFHAPPAQQHICRSASVHRSSLAEPIWLLRF